MVATYRLQLTPDFGFGEVQQLLPYFVQLGISHLYLSPITMSRPGSTHGYDVTDHNRIRDDFGGREAFEHLAAATHEAGMGLILDFVPNHSGVGPHNAYWQDVLAYGPHSAFAPYFDIDWMPIKPELHGKILLPFLGRPYGEVLDEGELTVAYRDGRFYAAYYENQYALNPASYDVILEAIRSSYERTDEYWDLKDLVEAYEGLDPNEREKAETLRTRLTRLLDRIDIEDALEELDGLHELFERQFWRLSYWKTAGYEINYRRFFDINGLVALRMEDEHVFWDAHHLLSELLAVEGVTGVRIDHVDGLFDPHDYLEHLHDLGAAHIWVEKILAPGEVLPEEWPVEGTTGYAFMNDVMGVLVQPEGRLPLERTYNRFVPNARAFADVVYASKKLVMGTMLSSELFRLSYELDRISEADYHTRDFTLEALREALSEMVAVFDRYRTYLPHDLESAREIIRATVHRARQRNPVGEPTVYDFVASVILGDVREGLEDVQRAWVGRFQQYTAPVAAKGVEDTAFYRHLPLVALNEVGGEPDHFGQTVHAFHSHARFRAHRFPRNLLATATHDHKRGEDTRMRLIALSEIPDVWDEAVNELDALSESYRSDHGPSRADQYLFFQVLAALWHDGPREELPDRLWAYMQKASRERKKRTSWVQPDQAYEESLERFVRGMLEDEGLPAALDDVSTRMAELGFENTLSQLVLKMTTPGVPDIYQGREFLDLSLVDPDNRRPVDFPRRRELLSHFDGSQPPTAEELERWLKDGDERLKLYVTVKLLHARRDHRKLFLKGDYQPLEGPEADTAPWIAFARSRGTSACVIVVPRFPASRRETEGITLDLPEALSERSWRDVLTGRALQPGSELSTEALPLPWAVLLAVPDVEE